MQKIPFKSVYYNLPMTNCKIVLRLLLNYFALFPEFVFGTNILLNGAVTDAGRICLCFCFKRRIFNKRLSIKDWALAVNQFAIVFDDPVPVFK